MTDPITSVVINRQSGASRTIAGFIPPDLVAAINAVPTLPVIIPPNPAKAPALAAAVVYALSATVNLNAGEALGPETGTATLLVPSPAGRNIDAVRVAPGRSNAVVRNLIVETSGSKVASAVSVSADNCRVSNVTSTGTGRAMTFSGAKGLDADLIVANNGRGSEYSIYAGGDRTPNVGCRIRRFDLWVGPGDKALAGDSGQQHGVRCHNHDSLILGDDKLRLPWMPQWSWYVKDTSNYTGAGVTLKEGRNALIQHGRCDGPMGFGPLDVSRAAHPDWKLDGLTILGCEVNTPTFLHFGWGVHKVLVKDTLVRAVAAPVNGVYDLTKIKGSCLSINSDSGGTFENVTFVGERLCDASNAANLKNWTFKGCRFAKRYDLADVRPLGARGEVN